MIQSRKQPVYLEITSRIIEKIDEGFFSEGERLPSRRELCEQYDVSDMTALKVQKELEKNGAAYRVRGKGVYACRRHKKPVKKKNNFNTLDKLVVFYYENDFTRTGYYGNKILAGIQKRACELGINIRIEFFSERSQGSCHVDENEGLIIPYRQACDWMLPLIMRKRIRCVLIENYFPESYCVLNDNYSGISQLVDYLESKGCRKFIFATKHFGQLGLANLSDRKYAFIKECEHRGLKYQLAENGNYNDLLKLVKNDLPDAVMFSTDAPALKFKTMLEDSSLKKEPYITGFDAWSSDTDKDVKEITTVKVNYEEMGTAAVDLILNNTLDDWLTPETIRVPCNLIINEDREKSKK